MSSRSDLKLGLHSYPTDQEVLAYLDMKVNRRDLPTNLIIEKNIYHKEPWNIFQGHGIHWEIIGDGSRITYCFSRLPPTKWPKKIPRIAGSGSWHGETGTKSIRNNNGDIIGQKKNFRFIENGKKKGDEQANGRWTMVEYSLEPRNLFVVCKITCRISGEILEDTPNDNTSSTPGGEIQSINEDDGGLDLDLKL